MDYKQKYEQALEYMRTVYPTLNGAAKEDVEHYFPELKVSEDEKIREWLIRLINTAGYRELDTDKMPCSRASVVAWLEKQDPKKHEEELEKAYKTADEVQYRKGFEDAKREFEKYANNRPILKENEIKVGDIITYFRDGKKGIMLVSSFDAGIYPRCKWGITHIDGTAYSDWNPGYTEYYAATEEEKQQLYNTMPEYVKDWLKSLKERGKENNMKTIYDINHNGIKLGEYISIGKLEYWFWFVTKSLPYRKHLFGNLFWRIKL